jgi:transcription elongation factor SPT6
MYHSDQTQIPEEDRVNYNYRLQEEQTKQNKHAQIQKRKIQHQRFQNISSNTAVNYLKKEDNGEFYFRPSSRGDNHLTLTWKFYETNIVHIDIVESEKAIGANIGAKLTISDETYENLQEIVERYIMPCNRSLREVIQHSKFQKCQNLEEIKKVVEAEKAED